MANMRKYGMTRSCVPNRDADKRRRNKAFFKGQNFVAGEDDRLERKWEKQMKKQKEAAYGR